MSTTPPPSPDPTPSVWPPPPTTPDIVPTRRPFVSLLPLARAVAALGVLDWLSYLGVKLMKAHQITPSNTMGSALMTVLVSLVFFVSYLVYRIIFLRWTFLAYRNLDSFEAAGLETTAGWAIGWFFVPVVNFYRPYLIFHELWKAGAPSVDSRDEVAWQLVPSSPLIGWWWSAVMIDMFLPGMLSRVLTNGLTSVASTTLGLTLSFASISFSIAVALAISRRQEAKARELTPSRPGYF
jgi:hypothetical protein